MNKLVVIDFVYDFPIAQQSRVTTNREGPAQSLTPGECGFITHEEVFGGVRSRSRSLLEDKGKSGRIAHPIMAHISMALLEGRANRALGQVRREDVGRRIAKRAV